jgi:hypothetical protein
VSGADTFRHRLRQYLYGLPGKRGIDIPEQRFDQIHQHASAITQPVWGQPPTPHQLQHLHDHTDGSAEQIQGAFGHLPHPSAKGLTLGEYQQWKAAHQAWQQHVEGRR